jgi:hypothetical protein
VVLHPFLASQSFRQRDEDSRIRWSLTLLPPLLRRPGAVLPIAPSLYYELKARDRDPRTESNRGHVCPLSDVEPGVGFFE